MAWTERYVDQAAAGGGDGTTSATSGANGAFTFAEFITDINTPRTGYRYNMKRGAGGAAYAQTTNTRTISAVGTTTAPNWLRGYHTTPGDIATDPTLPHPSLTFTTGRLVLSGSHLFMSNIDMTSAFTTGGTLNLTGASCRFYQCRFDNTNAATGSIAVSNVTSGSHVFLSCRFTTTTTAVRAVQSGATAIYNGCVFVGGLNGLDSTGGVQQIIGCVFRSNGNHGYEHNSVSAFTVQHCTFYDPTNDGVRVTTLPATTTAALIANNIFHSCAVGINNNTGTDTNLIVRLANSFYNCGSNETGFGDSVNFKPLTESVSPVLSATDMTLVPTALSVGSGSPGLFEGETYTTYRDRGAVQDFCGVGTATCPECPDDTGTGSLICPECPDDTGTGTTTTVYVHTGSPFNGPF